MMYIVYYLITMLVIFMVILYMINKDLKSKEEQIDILQTQMNNQHEKNNQLHEISKPNRRKNHRLVVYNAPVEVQILSTEEEKFQKVVGKSFDGVIKDISQSGMKVLSNYSLPIQGRFKVNVTFTLSEENFVLKAIMLRKEEHLKENMVSYGMKFFGLSNRIEQKLAFILHKIEAERRKKIA